MFGDGMRNIVRIVLLMPGASGRFAHIIRMDRMVGGDFERGLANLKGIAESAPAAP